MNDGFTGEDLATAIMLGNQVALQWYAVTHNTAIPGTPGSVVIGQTNGGYAASFGSGSLLIIGLLIVGAIVLMK